MRDVHESRISVNGVELAVFERPGSEPAAFFAHATGFHARCWDQVVEHLPGRRCIALDMRGHGRSEKPDPPYAWINFGKDVAALLTEMKVEGAVGVGHSKGGHAVTYGAGHVPGAFRALLLVDPVIMSRETYRRATSLQEHFASRRRNEWASPQEMFDRFKDRAPFSHWDPAVLRDYCDYGLLPAPAGKGYVLACPPAIEAATYMGSSGSDIYDEIESIDVPVRILRAKSRGEGSPSDMSGSPTFPGLAGHFRRGEDISLPEHTHFIPMEAPALVARHVEELATSDFSGN